MTQITFINKTRARPSLEFYSDGTRKARRVTIEKSPFRIGRAETADLRIDSAQVSREHAELLDRGGVWFVRDLGSTNGTLINGKHVTETLLGDGDVLRIAEMELTFIGSPASQFQRMVTHPVHARDPRSTASHAIPMEIAAARALAEATLWQTIPVALSTAVSLHDGTVEAVFASLLAGEGTNDPQSFFRSRHPAAARYRQLYRRRAVEIAAESNESQRLFISFDAVELQSQERLFAELKQLKEWLPADSELGIMLPTSSVPETLQTDELYRAVRDLGLMLAFKEFQGNVGQLAQFDAGMPDYVLLSESITEGLPDTRQPLARLESLPAACEQLGIKPVLPRCDCSESLAQCRQAGYDLALESMATKLSAKLAEPVAAC